MRGSGQFFSTKMKKNLLFLGGGGGDIYFALENLKLLHSFKTFCFSWLKRYEVGTIFFNEEN